MAAMLNKLSNNITTHNNNNNNVTTKGPPCKVSLEGKRGFDDEVKVMVVRW